MAERSFTESVKPDNFDANKFMSPLKKQRQYDLFIISTTMAVISMLMSAVGIFLAIVL